MFTFNLIVCIVNLVLTTLGLFGIWKRNTKLLSAYIIYSYIQSILTAYFLLVYVEIFHVPITIMLFPFLFIFFWMVFLISFFVLHLNIINFTTANQPTPNTESKTGNIIGLQQVWRVSFLRCFTNILYCYNNKYVYM